MRRRHFAFSLPAMAFIPKAAGVEANACRPATVIYPNNPNVTGLRIFAPGNYCLLQDYYQRKLGWVGHYGSGMTSMVELSCGSVILDMKGHSISSDFMQHGITLNAQSNRQYVKKGYYSEISEASLDNRFVTIRNGTINLADGEDETWTGIELIDAWHPNDFKNWHVTEARPPLFDGNYTRNEYLIESTKIYTRDIGILIEGSHNVIRNCVIHASGQGGIISAGPNLIVENCEIWLKPSSGEKHVAPDMSRAGIILCDGSNAIIRNNTIRVSPRFSSGRQPNCIVVRDNASNVLIEGNTFVTTVGEDIRLAKGSQTVVRNNKHINRRLPW